MRHRFRPRRLAILIGCALFIIVCIYMYMILETANLGGGSFGSDSVNPVDGDGVDHLKAKVHEMEQTLEANRKTIDEIKSIIRSLSQRGEHTDWKRLYELIAVADKQAAKALGSVSRNTSQHSQHSIVYSQEMCELVESLHSNADIQMMNVMEGLPFDNPDGGAWKQGFPISYAEDQWKSQKLKVFVIPHSHNDPGWIKTFEQYYEQQTRLILNLMVAKLEQHPQMRFIYAEMSFFSLWWSEISADMRARVKKLVAENRLEIVTGGWVMTDEATAHYYSMLDQLIEGNQWLINEVGVKPTSGWAIDPFGHTPTMAYLLGQTGMKNMLIQRVHYAVKKYLSKNKQLEFIWRQNWDKTGHGDMFCHMMPFYSYDIPHTCGPNPSVCCQFDFKRLPGGKISCPWKIPPVQINEQNVAERAQMLLQQYREKSQLYKNNVVLIPLGDDFRYDTPEEWDNQYVNYQALFDYMNKQDGWGVEAKFGTLSDYFNALRERATATGAVASQPASSASLSPPGYPVLSGDFFSYADRDDHYWTGYFTSRPFYKGLDRVVEGYQRAGEIIYSLALAAAHRHQVASFAISDLMNRCTSARRHLGLFQHHDGITGTARDFVVANYGDKLLDAISDMKRVITDSAQLLLTEDKSKYSAEPTFFDLDDKRETHDSLPVKTVICVKDGPRTVVFYNSLARNRVTVVRIHVDSENVEVRSPDNVVIASQVDPFIDNNDISTTTFKLLFVVDVPALGLARYTVNKAEGNKLNSVATVTLYNTRPTHYSKGSTVFSVEHKDSVLGDGSFTIENSQLVATLSSVSGMLQQVWLKSSDTVLKTNLEFVRYGTRPGKERSGAYLFLPDGEAKTIESADKPVIYVVTGPVASEVHVEYPVVKHIIRLADSPGLDGQVVDILNLVDIRTESNYELAMRLQTNIANSREFYADLNGFQMQRRQTYDKLPLNANFYPMTTAAYLQDAHLRLSVLSAQSLGVASLKPGWLELMQDRRLNQDDNRGLLQPVQDNKKTPNRFRLVIEQRQPGVKNPSAQPAGFMSLLAHLASVDLVHPIYVLPVRAAASSSVLSPVYRPLVQEVPCELHVVNLRTIPPGGASIGEPDDNKHKAALILHRTAVDCTLKSTPLPKAAISCPVGNPQVPLSSFGVSTAHRTSLTLLSDLGTQDVNANVDLPPMELQAYVVTLR